MDRKHLSMPTQEASDGDVSRRDLLRRAAVLGLGAPAVALVAAPADVRAHASVAAARQEAEVACAPGGTLRVATIGEPPTLDEHQTTAEIVAEIGYNIYENLFTYDENYQPIPELAESYEVSNDGLVYTIKLREGVPFHNGEELTAEDVIASLERWGRISGVGQNLMEATEEIVAVDDYTIEWRLKEPYGTLLVALAHNTQAPVIYPASVIEAAGDEPITEFIGTGPYKLVEWQPDRAIRLERFEDYAALPGEPVGYGGHKYAYADAIEFIPVPDVAARVAGLQAGDYDLALEVGSDQYETLRNAPGVVAEILPPSNWDVFFLNWKSPIMSNPGIRKAFQAALDMEPILLAGRGSEEFIRLDPGLMMQESPWYTTAGEDLYNIGDPELARQLLEEAGYAGEPIRFLTTQEYPYMYAESAVAAQQLEEAGFNVDLQVVDWATLVERRANPEAWDVFSTGHGFVPDPSQISYVGQMNVYPGWWDSPESLALAEELLSATDFERRYELWEQLQQRAYEEVPAVKIGDSSDVSYRSANIGNWTTQIERGIPYWNLCLVEQ